MQNYPACIELNLRSAMRKQVFEACRSADSECLAQPVHYLISASAAFGPEAYTDNHRRSYQIEGPSKSRCCAD